MKDNRLDKMGTRRIDELGRIVLPMEIRKNLEIREGDLLEFFTDSSKNIIIKKYNDTCIFCNSQEDLIELENKMICEECAKKICNRMRK